MMVDVFISKTFGNLSLLDNGASFESPGSFSFRIEEGWPIVNFID